MQISRLRALAVLLLLPAVLAVPRASAAAPARLIAADARGVTLAVHVPPYRVSPPDADGRSTLSVPGFEEVSLPARPQLPYISLLIALPPGAGATVRVVSGSAEETRAPVRIAIQPRAGFRDDGELGVIPTLEQVEPIADGMWPRAAAEVGETVTMRRQRLATVRVYPFRYDESARRLVVQSDLTVRVDFTGSAPAVESEISSAPDRHWDPVFQSAVLNYEQGRRWRAPAQRARTGSTRSLFGESSQGTMFAFDEDEPEVRVRLDSTAVYVLTFANLATHGYPAGVPVAEVSVHRHEFFAGQIPSYGTLELPVEVDDVNSNGVFDAGDRVVLFVQNWAERSRASVSQRAWGDGEVIYATRLSGRSGLRMTARSGAVGVPLTPLASYRHTSHFEENHEYLRVYQHLFANQPAESDTNTDQFLWTTVGASFQPDSFNFDVQDPDPSHPVDFNLVWQGMKYEPHVHWAHVRNPASQVTPLLDSLVWFGRGTLRASATVPGSAVGNGNNVLRTWGWTTAARQVVLAGFNLFDVSYWRGFDAFNGYLPARASGVTGDFQIHATGFGSRAIRVYDVTDSLSPVRITLDDSLIVSTSSGFVARFRDTNAGGVERNYVVFETPKPVPADRYGTVTRRRLSNRGSGDYLLIVPEEFLPAVGPLDSLRRAHGLDVVVAPLESVNDEFNGGRKSVHSIRRFIRYAYDEWNASFVMLVGDGSEDPLNVLGNSGIDHIPVQKVAGPVGVFDGASSVNEANPSDTWYVSCIDCPNPPPHNQTHDLFLGRLPVNSLEEAAAVVHKLVQYEIVDPADTWRRRMVLSSDDKYSTQTFVGNPLPDYCRRGYEEVFARINQSIRSVILDEAGLKLSDPELFDLNAYLAGVPTFVSGFDTCRTSLSNTQLITHTTVTDKLINRLNEGRLWWNYQGHANQYVLAHEDFWVNRGSNDDHLNLVNDDKLFFFSAFSCHPNGFAVVSESVPSIGPSLGEDMVTLPNRGAVASWGSSGFEILPGSSTNHLNVRLARALFSDPPRDPQLGERGARVVLGEAIALTIARNVAAVNSSLERDVGISYVLLGDPATRLSIGAAQILATANGVPVTDGVPVRLSVLSDTLKLEVDLVSNVELTQIVFERTDGGGTVGIPPADYTITPAFPDTAAGGGGGRRYHLSYRTLLGLGSYRYTIRTLDRYGVAARLDVVFEFQTLLRADGVGLQDGDRVSPAADLALRVVSPARLTAGDFTVKVNGISQVTRAETAPTDTSGREWLVRWDHAPYASGSYVAELTVQNVIVRQHRFQVETRVTLDNVMAFPNPFDDDLGTVFSFYLTGPGPADLLLRVFTVSGKLVVEKRVSGVSAAYAQIPWDGLDAEGGKLANGTYFYRLLALSGGSQVMHEGKLVKLRKPRRTTSTEP